jgi:sugar/nucleoside kinase (ribokinase family)
LAKRILAFGNPVYDIISTPVLVRSERILSGCSTNACLAATRLGVNATLVGMVGGDYKETLEADLRERKVEFHLLPSGQTGGFSLIYYDGHGNRELTLLGVADPIQAYNGGFDGVDFILIGPILGEVNADLVIKLRSETDLPIFTDPQGLLRNQKEGQI